MEAAFAGFGEPAGVLPPRPVEQAQTGLRVRVAKDKITESHLSRAWHIPDMLHPDIHALDVLSILLGHGESSRLSRGIKHGRRLVNDVYAYKHVRAQVSSTLDKFPDQLQVRMGRGQLSPAKFSIKVIEEIRRLPPQYS